MKTSSAKEQFFHFRASAEEIEKIKANAARAGMRPSVFVRDLALSGGNLHIVPYVNENAVFELRRLGAMLKGLYPKNSNWTNEEKRAYWSALESVLNCANSIANHAR